MAAKGWGKSKVTKEALIPYVAAGIIPEFKRERWRVPAANEEPLPRPGEFVLFLSFLDRGLALPSSDFFRQLLSFYNIKVSDLGPHSVQQIVLFVALCECYLGCPPYFPLWVSIFYGRATRVSKNEQSLIPITFQVKSGENFIDMALPKKAQSGLRRHSSSTKTTTPTFSAPPATLVRIAVVFHAERPPRRASPEPQMEPYVQTETYDLENGGSLVFERDLYLVSEKLERPPPQFHGVRIHNTPAGEQQWMITADLKGSPEPPISERILFSFKAYSWVDGLAHALQEGLARVCGQNIAALRGSRFAHFARHDTMGEPMALSSHPVLKIHVQHLDFMLHETRKDLELTRVHAHRAQMALAHHADAIRLLAKDRRSLRLQRAKNVATITRLREKIRTLEVTVRTQQDQIQEMEEDGEDIQGGDDFLSDDNDFEDDEFTDEEDYEFLEAAEDGIIPIDVDEDNEE
ncbi:hypothetical protein QYE76_002599 [Lolium multiflorum]|uniref:Transposase (putative) gypsy type domain-containing protein n=1 Tax=Lolium multiflorum TaxID=4521 RepID=A0AAD8RNN3_LOLMU|nr:hypothetical protein QYE76_002599 [Lolium multiflorum]